MSLFEHLCVFCIIFASCHANTIQSEKNIILYPRTWTNPTIFSCTLRTGKCPMSKPEKLITYGYQQCNTAVFNINMNFQATNSVSFIVVSGSSFNNPYASPLNYNTGLSVLYANNYRSYNTYTGQQMEGQLSYIFRNDAPNFQNVSLNYTIDLCCNSGCGRNENSAAFHKINFQYIMLLIFFAVTLKQ
jgi:hypothetical protein